MIEQRRVAWVSIGRLLKPGAAGRLGSSMLGLRLQRPKPAGLVGLVLVCLAMLAGGVLAPVVHAEALSPAELEKLPAMTEWVLRNGAETDPVGCGEGCAHLWSAEHGTTPNGPAAQEIFDQLGAFEAADGLWPPLSRLATDLGYGEATFEVGPWTLGWHVYGASSSKWMRFSEVGASTTPQVGWCDSAGSYYEDLLAPGQAYGAEPQEGAPPQPKAPGWIYDGRQRSCNYDGIGYYDERNVFGCTLSVAVPTPWSGWDSFSQQFGTCEGVVKVLTALRTRAFHYSIPEEFTSQTALHVMTDTGPETAPSREAVEAALKLLLEGSAKEPFGTWLRYVTTGEGYDPTQVPLSSELYGGSNAASPDRITSCTEKPVSCATGNETVSQRDYSIPGRGVPLNLSRTYNSQAAVLESSPGPFGYGWSSSFSDHLSINAEAGTVTVHQANGSTVAFKGHVGTPGALSAAPWVQATLVANSDASYSYRLPDQEAFHFTAAGQLSSVADRNGNTTTLTYALGRLEAITDPAGRKITLAYNTEGLVESAKDPMGHLVKYSYEAGKLASVTEPGETSPRWQFKYDSSHQLTELIDGRAGKTTDEYDSSHRVISQTDPAGRKLTLEYQAEGEGLMTTITNHATGAATKERFDGAHEPTSIVRGEPATITESIETSGYNAAGELTSHTDGNGHMTSYTYDTAGNRTSSTDPLGDKTSWTYNATHDVESTTTPNGETTTIARNSHGEPETISRPAPGSKTQSTTYKYNSYGELISVEDPLKRVSSYEYNTNGDRISATDPEGDKQTWGYNEDSQVTSSVSPRGHVAGAKESKFTTTTERDAQGRAIKVTDPLGHETKYAYDANGNLESVTDPEGNKTTYTYDADNEQIRVEAPNKTVTETGYDGAGQVVSQTDGNKHITKHVRNVLEEVTEVVDPLGRKTVKEYDFAGNLTHVTDASKRVTSFVYDEANRLLTTTYSEEAAQTTKYGYDKDGHRTSMSDATGTSSYGYDQLDRLTETKDGHGATVSYEYDLANEQTKITYPNGKALTRTYDGAGRLKSVTDWLEHTTKFAYDADSDLTSTTFPAGTSNEDTYSYNEADAMSEAKMSKGTEVLASLVYTRSKDGQITKATTKGLPGEEKPAFAYDENSRLSKGAGITYKYDAANNPTKIASASYTYNNANELESATGYKYTYNETGERTKTTPTTGPPTSYGYNQAGALASITRAHEGETPAITDTYNYDGTGLRASQTTSGTIAYLTWDTSKGLPLILNDSTNSYIDGPAGLPIEQINVSTGSVAYLHHDQAGSTRLLTGSTGTKEASFTYDAYGNATGTSGTAKTPLGYDGQYTNSDTGLIYLRARVYDPATAQFLTVDPMVGTTRAPYTYAGDDPLNRSDPGGLDFLEEAGEGIAGWGDTFTFGATKWAREELGDNNVNTCSTAYRAGGVAGLVTAVVIPGDGEARLGVEGVDAAASTGRAIASGLDEQLAMEEAMSNPAAGTVLGDVTMSDPRWPASQGWVKMAQNINGVEIHYVRNETTGAVADFKYIKSAP